MPKFQVTIYNRRKDVYNEELTVRKSFIVSRFETLEECHEYYSKSSKYKNFDMSASPLIDGMTVGDKLHQLNKEARKEQEKKDD